MDWKTGEIMQTFDAKFWCDVFLVSFTKNLDVDIAARHADDALEKLDERFEDSEDPDMESKVQHDEDDEE